MLEHTIDEFLEFVDNVEHKNPKFSDIIYKIAALFTKLKIELEPDTECAFSLCTLEELRQDGYYIILPPRYLFDTRNLLRYLKDDQTNPSNKQPFTDRELHYIHNHESVYALKRMRKKMYGFFAVIMIIVLIGMIIGVFVAISSLDLIQIWAKQNKNKHLSKQESSERSTLDEICPVNPEDPHTLAMKQQYEQNKAMEKERERDENNLRFGKLVMDNDNDRPLPFTEKDYAEIFRKEGIHDKVCVTNRFFGTNVKDVFQNIKVCIIKGRFETAKNLCSKALEKFGSGYDYILDKLSHPYEMFTDDRGVKQQFQFKKFVHNQCPQHDDKPNTPKL